MIALERRVRTAEAQEYVDALAPLIADDVPVFMTGDFNSPSHLDWTEEASAARDLPYALEWPASKAFADAGWRDSYRDANPDPAATPGLTWTAGQPPPRMRPSETNDRIDWVLAAGPSTTVSSQVVGEQGGPDVGVGVSPWGSDHRGVVSEFSVEPADAPYLVSASPRRVERGDRVTLRFSLAGGGPGRTVGYVAGADPRVKPEATIPIYDASDHIAPYLGTAAAKPGRQTAVLLDDRGEPLASSPFWIVGRGAQPSIATSRATYAPGEPIEVSWSDGPGNKLDYVGIFKASEPSVYGYLGYLYADARVDGACGSPAPTPAGSPPAATSPGWCSTTATRRSPRRRSRSRPERRYGQANGPSAGGVEGTIRLSGGRAPESPRPPSAVCTAVSCEVTAVSCVHSAATVAWNCSVSPWLPAGPAGP